MRVMSDETLIYILLQKIRKDCDLFAERQKGTFELCAKCSKNLCHVFGVSAERTTGNAIIALDSVLIKSSPVVVAIWGGGGGRAAPKNMNFARIRPGQCGHSAQGR